MYLLKANGELLSTAAAAAAATAFSRAVDDGSRMFVGDTEPDEHSSLVSVTLSSVARSFMAVVDEVEEMDEGGGETDEEAVELLVFIIDIGVDSTEMGDWVVVIVALKFLNGYDWVEVVDDCVGC